MMDLLIGCAVAALSGMGVGGGGLLLIFLTMIRDFEITKARVTGLLFFILSAGSSLPYHKKKRRIPWRYVLLLTLSAIPGVFVGNGMARTLSVDGLHVLFGIFFLITGAMGLWRCIRGRKKKNAAT